MILHLAGRPPLPGNTAVVSNALPNRQNISRPNEDRFAKQIPAVRFGTAGDAFTTPAEPLNEPQRFALQRAKAFDQDAEQRIKLETNPLETAAEWSTRAYALRMNALGPEHPDVGKSLLRLAKTCESVKQPEAALLFYRGSAGPLLENDSHFNTHFFNILNGTTITLIEEGKRPQADFFNRLQLAFSEEYHGKESGAAVSSLWALAGGAQATGRDQEAIDYYKRALDIVRRGTVNEPTLYDIAHPSSEDWHIKTPADRKPDSWDHHHDKYLSYGLGMLYFKTKNYRAALPLLERVLHYEKEEGFPPNGLVLPKHIKQSKEALLTIYTQTHQPEKREALADKPNPPPKATPRHETKWWLLHLA